MNDFANDILGLDGLRFGAEGAALGWAHPLPAWAWAMIVLAAIAVAGWSYARLAGPRAARVALAGVRTLLLLLIAFAAAGPRLERQRTETEPDRVAILVDRSASLGVRTDRAGTRDDQLRDMLSAASPTLAGLAESKDLDWLAFDAGVSPIEPLASEPGQADLPAAEGQRTAIGSALTEALRRAAGRPLSGVVVFSDGRSADAVPPEALRALQAERVPVHVVPLGSADPAPEFAVVSAEAPAVAYVEDTVPVTVLFDAERIDADDAGAVEIIDDATGLTLERRELTPEDLAAGRATLSTTAADPGEQRWTVRYVPGGPDLSSENNAASLSIRLVDQPIRVLYVDGSPRWENRYLKSLLTREDSIDSSSLLLAVNRRFQQEGDTVLTALPQGDEWSAFDVVIIGDIAPELLGQRTLEEIRDLVGDQAAGLLWLAGPTATPLAWGDTPLTDLLPLAPTGDDAPARVALWDRPVVLEPTPLAERQGVFASLTADTAGISDAEAGWSGLRWAIRVGPDALKASAETLALATPVDDGPDDPTPLVVSMRYGSGRVALVGTDEIWRWRYGRGEPPTEQFWLPLIRSLARARLAEVGAAATLEVTPPIVQVGRTVSLELTITDQSIAEIAPARIEATVRERGPEGAAVGTVRLDREPGAPAGRVRYAGSMPALQPGSFRVEIPADALAGVAVAAGLEVISPDDELRNPQTDHPFLADLAERTGGRVFTAADLDTLPSALPNRRVIVPLTPETTTLWDRPFTLALLLGLLTIEWVGRRLIRLA